MTLYGNEIEPSIYKPQQDVIEPGVSPVGNLILRGGPTLVDGGWSSTFHAVMPPAEALRFLSECAELLGVKLPPLVQSQVNEDEHYDPSCEFVNGVGKMHCTCDSKWDPNLDFDETDALLQAQKSQFEFIEVPGLEGAVGFGQWAPAFYKLTDGRTVYVNMYGSGRVGVRTKTGHILTEAEVDVLVDEAEAGYDPAQFQPAARTIIQSEYFTALYRGRLLDQQGKDLDAETLARTYPDASIYFVPDDLYDEVLDGAPYPRRLSEFPLDRCQKLR